MKIKKGKLLVEGKTKSIFEAVDDADSVVVEYKNTITAFDDPNFTKEFDTKAKYSNLTTSRIFEHLRNEGIPVAYKEQFSDIAFVSPKCTMIPLEVVARRYAVGSYLKRHPEYDRSDSGLGSKKSRCPGRAFVERLMSSINKKTESPCRFNEPLVEFFLKTTRGSLKIDDKIIVDGLDPAKGEEDPFIMNPLDEIWKLAHSKKQEDVAYLHKKVNATDVLQSGATVEKMAKITAQTFLALEGLWRKHNFKLIDFKIEFGVSSDGNLLVADVIDNDSWRLRDKNWNDISKQSFRDGDDLKTIEDKYALVAHLLNS